MADIEEKPRDDEVTLTPVSYTHLDVYKRQEPGRIRKCGSNNQYIV